MLVTYRRGKSSDISYRVVNENKTHIDISPEPDPLQLNSHLVVKYCNRTFSIKNATMLVKTVHMDSKYAMSLNKCSIFIL